MATSGGGDPLAHWPIPARGAAWRSAADDLRTFIAAIFTVTGKFPMTGTGRGETYINGSTDRCGILADRPTDIFGHSFLSVCDDSVLRIAIENPVELWAQHWDDDRTRFNSPQHLPMIRQQGGRGDRNSAGSTQRLRGRPDGGGADL